MPDSTRYTAHDSTVDLAFERRPGALVATVAGHLDLNTAAHVREQLLEQVGQEVRRPTVLDLDEVELLDSAGIGALAVLSHTLSQAGTPISVVTTSRHHRKLFRIAALDQAFGVYDSVGQALHFGGGEPVDAS